MIVSYKPKWSEDNELLKSGDCNNTSFHSLNSSIKDLKDVSYDIKVISKDNYLKSIKIDGKEINDFAVSNSRLSITEEIEKNASVRPKKESEFRVVIKNSIPKEWTNLYNEDDKSIKSNASIQGQTFGLKYLLEGLLEGTCSDNLVDISFKFKK